MPLGCQAVFFLFLVLPSLCIATMSLSSIIEPGYQGGVSRSMFATAIPGLIMGIVSYKIMRQYSDGVPFTSYTCKTCGKKWRSDDPD